MSAATRLARYQTDGFLVLPDFMSGGACDGLRARAAGLVAAFDPGELRSVFSTRNQVDVVDRYFLESGDQIRFFFEEEAAAAGIADKERSINKIGHALHDLDPVFDRFSRDPKIAALVAELGIANPLLLQSMYIFKQPFIGGEVRCHQDATFLYTEPLRVIGLWFALEDAHRDNGCLWVLPGGHRLGLKSRYLRDGQGKTRFETVDTRPFPDEGLVPLEVPKGTVIVLDSLLPHLSQMNRSPLSRNAYTLHVIDGNAAYPSTNWLQRRADFPARGF
jgi:phytanoyl-CoA hydroxylase